MGQHATGGFLEYKSRVVFSLLRIVARIGIRLRLPLGHVGHLLKMAYFEEAREQQGLELESIAQLFGKSLRTVSTLNRQFRGDFFAPEREVQLRRQIADHLKTRATTGDDFQALFADRDPDDLTRALEDLVREGRVIEAQGRFHRNPEDHDYFDEHDIVRRIDGLNRQMDIVGETVWTRLVDPSANSGAAARSYVFNATDDDFDKLIDGLLTQLRTKAIAADTAAQGQGVDTRRGITFAAVTLPGDDS